MELHTGLCTGLLLVVTSVVSMLAFANQAIEDKYIFHPASILAGKQYYRLVTAGFLHADWQHLGLNMVSLYMVGTGVEAWLGHADFLLIYFGAIIGGNLLSLYVHRHHEYLAYGASGGVCGILFAHILLMPNLPLYAFPIPFGVPGWLFAVIFLVGSFFALKTGRNNVGHDAHIGGAIIGLLLTAVLEPRLAQYHWKPFLLLLLLSSLLLACFWFNPLFLPVTSFLGRHARIPFRRSQPQKREPETREVDAILEKVSKLGIESLSREERAILHEVSGKYQRRADSKRPESDLII